MLLATINSGTLIIALPDLERALHTSILSLVWVILAYMISSTVLVLFAGRLSDLFGRKQAYVAGFVLFGETLPHGIQAGVQIAAFACLVLSAVALEHPQTPSADKPVPQAGQDETRPISD